MIRLFITWHKWVSVIFIFFILLFPVTGIILNHRKLFSHINVSRKLLPSVYELNNWNNSAVKGTEKIGQDSVWSMETLESGWLTQKGAISRISISGCPPEWITGRFAKSRSSPVGRYLPGLFSVSTYSRMGYGPEWKFPQKRNALSILSKRLIQLFCLRDPACLKQ